MFPKDKLNQHVFLLWFILAVVALAFSGIYSILPFVLRTPFLSNIFHLKDLFKISLVVHVDLAVLVWFLSSTAMLMTSVTKKELAPISFTAFIISMMGSIFMIASPFVGLSEPILNNYIPILHNLAFIIGISLFFTGIILQTLLTIVSINTIKRNLISFTIYMSALIFVVAILCFVKSALELKNVTRYIDMTEYYELLFWGAGHILQFNYIQLIIIAWLAIVKESAYKSVSKNFIFLQYINFALVVIAPIAYFIYPIDNAELYDFFTLHMKYFGGILTSITAIWVIQKIFVGQYSRIELTTFFSSLFLISSGGIIGYLISGTNVTVPAHYHGVIIGITVGLMGLFYLKIPEMGFVKPNEKSASWQMIIYSLGQFIHILGLAISGGYGALRKSPDGFLSVKAKIYMGIMGIGGAIALVGGIAFVTIIFLSIRGKTINEQKTN
jgi:cytochrome c oxidase subunit 1